MKMPQRLTIMLNWWSDHFWNTVAGFFFAIIAYFAEIKGAVHVMWSAFLIDLFIGIIASYQVKKEKFSMKKAFVALERMIIATVVVMLLYAVDKEMNQNIVSMYNIVAWVITGFMIYSIAENGFQMTGGKLFLVIKSLLRKKVQDNTGVDLENTESNGQA